MVHCVFTVRAAPPPTSPPLLPSMFFFLFSKGDFLAVYFSVFGGGSLGLLDLDLPPNCVCAVKASASHKGYFLSTAEDSKHGQNKPLAYLYPSQATHMQA